MAVVPKFVKIHLGVSPWHSSPAGRPSDRASRESCLTEHREKEFFCFPKIRENTQQAAREESSLGSTSSRVCGVAATVSSYNRVFLSCSESMTAVRIRSEESARAVSRVKKWPLFLPFFYVFAAVAGRKIFNFPTIAVVVVLR